MGSIIGYQEEQGTIVSFETDVAKEIKKLEVNIEPIQDLHGYDSPWPGGGGKNQLEVIPATGTVDEITATIDNSGTITVNGTCSKATIIFGNLATGFVGFGSEQNDGKKHIPNGSYNLFVNDTYAGISIQIYGTNNSSGTSNLKSIISTGTYGTITIDDTYAYNYARLHVAPGTYNNVSIRPYLIPSTETNASWSPYSNICPITGWTSATLNANGEVFNITFPSEAGTVYSGTLDMVKGELVVNSAQIASYNGETLPGEWISDRDVYAEGVSPTTGAQVVYELAAPITYQLTSLETMHVNKDTCTKMAAYIGGNGAIGLKNSCNLIYFKYQPETTYTISKVLSARFRVGYTNVIPDDKIQVDGFIQNNEGTTINITTPATGAQYLIIYYYDGDNETLSENEIYNSINITYEINVPINWEINTIIGTNTLYANTGKVLVYYPKTIIPLDAYFNLNLINLRRSIIASMKASAAKTYGVEWNYNNSSTVLTRTGNATNFNNPVPAESLNSSGSSPFDNIYPWSEMKRYNIINGEVAYSQDDVGYSETDYDTVVYIPEFYYKAEKDTINQKWNWSISDKLIKGYKKHPGSGRYVGRFHTSGSSSSGVFSKGGVAPLGSTSRANFRTYSHNKGSNWWQIDLATWSAIQILYLIEFANWNSQDALGEGQTSGSPKNTGATTGAVYHTVKRMDNGNAYRWIENPFSNIYTWVDGYVASDRASYISTDPASYGDTISGMEAVGITLPSSADYITGIGYSEKCAWAFIPDAASDGSATTKIPDYVSSNTSTRALYCGGYWWSNNADGAFCFNAYSSATSTSSASGSRLIYIPN